MPWRLETGAMPEATDDPTTSEQPPADPKPATDDALRDAGAAALADERKNRKAAEKAARDAQAQLADLEKSLMSDHEKAVADARAEGHRDGLREGGGRLVAAELRAAAVPHGLDVDALLEAVDPSRFLDDDGNVDAAAIAAWVGKVAPSAPAGDDGSNSLAAPPPPFPDLAQGVRPNSTQSLADPLQDALVRKSG